MDLSFLTGFLQPAAFAAATYTGITSVANAAIDVAVPIVQKAAKMGALYFGSKALQERCEETNRYLKDYCYYTPKELHCIIKQADRITSCGGSWLLYGGLGLEAANLMPKMDFLTSKPEVKSRSWNPFAANPPAAKKGWLW